MPHSWCGPRLGSDRIHQLGLDGITAFTGNTCVVAGRYESYVQEPLLRLREAVFSPKFPRSDTISSVAFLRTFGHTREAAIEITLHLELPGSGLHPSIRRKLYMILRDEEECMSKVKPGEREKIGR